MTMLIQKWQTLTTCQYCHKRVLDSRFGSLFKITLFSTQPDDQLCCCKIIATLKIDLTQNMLPPIVMFILLLLCLVV